MRDYFPGFLGPYQNQDHLHQKEPLCQRPCAWKRRTPEQAADNLLSIHSFVWYEKACAETIRSSTVCSVICRPRDARSQGSPLYGSEHCLNAADQRFD